MVRVLLDACVPQWLRTELGPAEVVTAQFARLDELTNGQLLAAIEGRFDVLVTLDTNIDFQQNLAGRSFAVLVLRVKDQSPESFQALVPALTVAIASAQPGEVRVIA